MVVGGYDYNYFYDWYKVENSYLADESEYKKLKDEERSKYLEVNNNKLIEIEQKKKNADIAKHEAIKLIAGLDNCAQIKNKLIKKIFHDNLDDMIIRYAEIESLPKEHVKIVKLNNCLEILIKGFFKKVGGFVLTSNLIDEIDSFIESIYINDDLKIVYERVSEIQRFIHENIDFKYGSNAHQKLPVKHIKNLLSASRLHLNIYDIKYMDSCPLILLIERSNEASTAEKINNKKISLPKGKKYIKNWRVRHMRPLLYFNYESVKIKIQNIYELDDKLPINEFKNNILDAYLN